MMRSFSSSLHPIYSGDKSMTGKPFVFMIGPALLLAGCSSLARNAANPCRPDSLNKVGAEGYLAWLACSCMPGLIDDLDSIVASAEAAADVYVSGNYPIHAFGDPSFISEALGRAGGLISLNLHVKLGPNSPDGKTVGVVLYCVREQSLAADLAEINSLHESGATVIMFARKAIIDAARQQGVRVAGFVDNHAAPNGGLYRAANGQWAVPTDPTANVVALWTWTGEFVAACTRRGKMPTMYKAFGSPGGFDWAKSIRGQRFHAEPPRPVAAGTAARSYLAALGASLAKIRSREMKPIRNAARLAFDARRAGRQALVFAHGHAIKDSPGCPCDPGCIVQANEGWFDPKPGIVPGPGDFLLYIGFGGMPDYGSFEKHDYLNSWRAAGASVAWCFGDMNHETFDAGFRKIRKGEPFIDQHMYQGDAAVQFPGYPIPILPTSGVTAEAVLWMIAAECHRLAAAETAVVDTAAAKTTPVKND